MGKTIILMFAFLFLLKIDSTCQNTNELRRMSDEERISYAEAGISFGPKTLFVDSLGNIISRSDFQKLETAKLFPEFWIDSLGNIKELRFRKLMESDKTLINKYEKAKLAYENKINNHLFKRFPVSCNQFKLTLKSLFENDQKIRKNPFLRGTTLQDYKNQDTLINFLEQCNLDDLKSFNEDALYGLWAVLQHSNVELMKRYRFIIVDLVQVGLLNEKSLKLLDDRILILSDEKQRHDTQFDLEPKTGERIGIK